VEVIEVIDVDTNSNTNDLQIAAATDAPTAEAVQDEDEVNTTTVPQPTAAPVPTMQTEVPALTTPSPIQPRRTIPSLIPFNPNSFQQQSTRARLANRGDRNEAAEKAARYRAVKKIIDAVLDPVLTQEQQVLALRLAIRSKILDRHSASAGLMIDNQILHYLLNNLKSVLQLATTTTKARGRPTDDMRSLVQTIVLGTLPSPTEPKKHSNQKIAELLELPFSTYSRAVKAVTIKRAT